MPTFAHRQDAGRRLGGALRERLRRAGAPIDVVLGLPRGGMIVAGQVAAALGLPLDVVVVRKLGSPEQPELGVGAVGEDGVRVVNEALVDRLDLDDASLDDVTVLEQDKVRRRVSAYADGRVRPSLAGRRVLIVDDGAATGYTALAAVGVVRGRGATFVQMALPVASAAAAEVLRGAVDDLVCLVVPRRFSSVGQSYEEFDQATDEQVMDALASATVVRR